MYGNHLFGSLQEDRASVDDVLHIVTSFDSSVGRAQD